MFKGKTLYKVHNKRIYKCISFLLNHVLSTLFPISVFVVDQNVQRNGSFWNTHSMQVFFHAVYLIFLFLKKKLHIFYIPKIEEFYWNILSSTKPEIEKSEHGILTCGLEIQLKILEHILTKCRVSSKIQKFTKVFPKSLSYFMQCDHG